MVVMWVRSLLQTIYIHVSLIDLQLDIQAQTDSSEASLNAMAPTAIAAVPWQKHLNLMSESEVSNDVVHSVFFTCYCMKGKWGR